MHQRIAFIGFGELGRQFLTFVENPGTEFIFFDDRLSQANEQNALPFENYVEDQFLDCSFVLSLGYLHLNRRKQVLQNLQQLQRKILSFVHPSTFIHPSVSVGNATFVYPGCNIDQNVRIAHGVILNNSVCISHNTSIGACSYLSPGVITSGYVEIGECTFIGSGSVISDHIRIGANVRIGIGSVVTADIPDGASAIGNPARILSRPLQLGRKQPNL
jgi:sugar O-acyltransferase (sialic acid O-acetyltransferase NeuD family)